MSTTEFNSGDRVVLDNIVPGRVAGFWNGAVVFVPDWKWSKGVWGTLSPRESRIDGEELPSHRFFFSKLLVHPSNLKKEER